MISLLRLLPAACFVAYGAFAAPGYHLVRIAPVLNQPTFVTQAPGDPPNILHYSTRISTALSGFSAQNTMGKIWRYDVNTRESTIVLDFSERTVVNDDGLQCFAFPPDFRNTESPLFGKIYVSSSQYVGGPALNLVEEFTILNPDGTPISPETAINTGRVILRYVNNSENNHTVDWIGFDPTATGEARNYLYISTGDGAFGRAYNGGFGHDRAAVSESDGPERQVPEGGRLRHGRLPVGSGPELCDSGFESDPGVQRAGSGYANQRVGRSVCDRSSQWISRFIRSRHRGSVLGRRGGERV